MSGVNPAEIRDLSAAMARKLAHLPPFGPAVLKLLSIALEEDSAARSFEDVFKSDPALTAELLMLANSAAFGGRARVHTIRVALRHLGLERVRSMAATSALRSHTHRGRRNQYLASVWAHSIASAAAAEALGDASGWPGLYTLGLTHDLGRLGLFLAGGPVYGDELSKVFANVEQANEVELGLFGMTHCEAGALVAATWGFPEDLAACMGEHHIMPSGSESRGLIATACRMADSLGFPEVPLSETTEWPDLGATLKQVPALEPEALWDEISLRIADLGH
jgi:HD-like signal output (HDOD) protein